MWTGYYVGYYLLVLISIICYIGVNAGENESLDFSATQQVSVVSQSAAFFAADVYQELRKRTIEDGNVAYSPYSLSTLLVMLYAGAGGKTASEIKTTLRLTGLNDSSIFESYSSISCSLKSLSSVTFKTANTIYTDDRFVLKQSYLSKLKKFFQGDAQPVNFAHKESTVNIINKWVSNHTDNKINELIKSESLQADTSAVLINAIYFKGEWVHKFDTKLTTKEKFYLKDEENEQNFIWMDFMRLETHFKYAEIERLEAEAISIPFQGDRTSLVVLVPKNTSTFHGLEERLKGFDLSTIPEDLDYTMMHLHLPKLRIESTIDFVKDSLIQNLGIKTVLGQNPKARVDLSKMAENSGNLHVSGIVQKVFVDLNEDGTEAAGVSHSVFVTKIFNPRPPVHFKVNRPFIAFIFDKLTKSVLFLVRKVK